VYAFTKEVFDNHSSFKQLHPVYEFLTKNDMLQGLSAPIHPGAMDYYKDVIFTDGSVRRKAVVIPLF
jgi:TRAP-type uncharacterized transport system substrate-binding protein